MTETLPPHVLELMASKLCHDIISPVGAVANGVEFLEEMGADAGEDVTSLISFSAGQASAKLQAFRMAYGSGGADNAIKPEDVHKSFENLIVRDDKVHQHWDPYAPIGPESYLIERPSGLSKMMMNVLILASDCLPKGGDIKLTASETEIRITALGENASLSEDAQNVLKSGVNPDTLTPKLIHPYLTGVFGRRYAMPVTYEGINENGVSLRIGLPQ